MLKDHAVFNKLNKKQLSSLRWIYDLALDCSFNSLPLVFYSANLLFLIDLLNIANLAKSWFLTGIYN